MEALLVITKYTFFFYETYTLNSYIINHVNDALIRDDKSRKYYFTWLFLFYNVYSIVLPLYYNSVLLRIIFASDVFLPKRKFASTENKIYFSLAKNHIQR